MLFNALLKTEFYNFTLSDFNKLNIFKQEAN